MSNWRFCQLWQRWKTTGQEFFLCRTQTHKLCKRMNFYFSTWLEPGYAGSYLPCPGPPSSLYSTSLPRPWACWEKTAGVTGTLNPIQRRPEGKEEQDLHRVFIFTVCGDLQPYSSAFNVTLTFTKQPGILRGNLDKHSTVPWNKQQFVTLSQILSFFFKYLIRGQLRGWKSPVWI